MWAWILIDEPSPVAEDTVHTALEMALRRDHRSLVIVPSVQPGRALVLGIGGAEQARSSVSAAENLTPEIARAFQVEDRPSVVPAASEEMPTAIDDEPVSPIDVETGPLGQVPGMDESSEAEPAAVEELSAAMPDEALSNPPQPPGPKYVATGFLGLVDEPISEEEPPPPTKWWRKLFG